MPIKYPKNYHSNGYGWHNLAAMGYAKAPQSTPTPAPPFGGHPGYPAATYGAPAYPMASLSMPMPPGAANYSGMPPLPGSAANVTAPYPSGHASGMQLSYGFASNVLPSQIPNAPRTEATPHAGQSAPNIAAPGIGWAIGGLSDATDSGDVHDPHLSQQESKYESIFVPIEDRPIYSNMRFFDVSIFLRFQCHSDCHRNSRFFFRMLIKMEWYKLLVTYFT